MKKVNYRMWVSAFILCGALLVVGGCSSADSLVVGNGLSESADSYEAGAQKAGTAKEAFGKGEPKVVLVFDSGNIKDKEQLIEGVGSVFDKSKVYGCSSYSPLTQQGNAGSVGVLALGGDIEVATAVAPVVNDNFEACGKQIGGSLKLAAQTEANGKVLLLFGKCHVPKNDELVLGVRGELGDNFPVAGGAATGELVYYQGKVVKSNNVGILLSGDFETGFCTIKDNSAQGLITSANTASRQAIGENSGKTRLMLAFDCGGRREMMGDTIGSELEAMKSAAGQAPIFGFYGSGEIGPADNDSPSKGVGYHLAVCAISAE